MPAAVVVALAVALALNPTWWLLVPLVIVLIGAIAVVVVGILQMLGGGLASRPAPATGACATAAGCAARP